MKRDVAAILRAHGIQPSAQRLAVAAYVLDTDEHPTAEEVCARCTRSFPMISRATVYNTLNLFVDKGLLRELVLAEGRTVFDRKLERTTTSSTNPPAPSTTSRGTRCGCAKVDRLAGLRGPANTWW